MLLSRIQPLRGLSLGQMRNLCIEGYAEHQAIWRFFPDSEERPFLYRREQIGQWPMFYVLSRVEPQQDARLWQIDIKPFNPQLAAGDRLAFMLRVNPVRSRRDEHDKMMRDDVVMRLKKAEQAGDDEPCQSNWMQRAGEQWLHERAGKLGCTFEQVVASRYERHRLRKSSQIQPIQFSTVDLQGTLRVTDAQTFLNRCFFGEHAGIGPSKSFGCGLLMIRKMIG